MRSVTGKALLWAGAVLFAAGMAWAAEPAAKPALRAWVLTGPDRALRSAQPTGVASAKIEAARNEWEFFQIAVRSTTAMPDLTLAMSRLAGPEGARIEGHAHIRLYREHQLYLPKSSPRNADFKPDWFPDVLIPFVNPADGSPLPPARFSAVPFVLPADETHVFLVEVYVPAGAKPGLYRGEATLASATGEQVKVPVELTVWDFELPRLAAMKTEFNSPAGRVWAWKGDRFVHYRPLPLDSPAMAEAVSLTAQMTTEHRINSWPPILMDPNATEPIRQKDGSFAFSPAQIEATKAFAAKYNVNALAVPVPSRFFGLTDREGVANYLRSWERTFEAAGLADMLCYTYIYDEPNDKKAYEAVQQWGKVIKEANTRVKRLVVEQPQTQNAGWGDLYGAVDIWVPYFGLFDPEIVAKRQALGEEVWAYTALCQAMVPKWQIDQPLLDYRAPAMIAWRYGVTGLLYAGKMSYWDRIKDPWTDPFNHGEYIGESNLLYPGGDAGFRGPISSLRLKALRSGLQDYDYLNILDQRGLREEAMKVIMRVGPAWDEYSHDPQAYLMARRALAGLILGKPVPAEALPAALPKDGAAAAARKLPEVALPLIKKGSVPAKPSIDGALDGIYAEQGATLKLGEAFSGGKPNGETTVCLARDEEALYVFFSCSEPKMAELRANVTERDGNLWEDDCVEVFLDRAGDGKRYAHIIVNPIGTVYDSRQDLGTEWNMPVSAATSRQKDSWTAELRLPFEALGGAPKPDEVWRTNFCRERIPLEQDVIVEEKSSWSVVRDGFQNPDRFGYVRMLGASDNPNYGRWKAYSEKHRSDDGLIAYFDFEEGSGARLPNKAVNPYGNEKYAPEKLDGKISNPANWTRTKGRWVGKGALAFNGSDYVACGSDVPNISTGAVTIELWTRTSSFPGAASRPVVMQGDSIGNGLYGVFYRSNGAIAFTAVAGNSSLEIESGPGAVVIGEWQHIVGVRNGDSMSIYKNGKLIKSGGSKGTMSSGKGTLFLGQRGDSREYFDGIIDEVGVYDRALTESEVQDHYMMGKP